VREDRDALVEACATDAQAAAERGDVRELHAIVSRLGGYLPRPSPAVKKLDGELTCSQEEHDQRWLQHFQEVFDAEVGKPLEHASTKPACAAQLELRTNSSSFKPSVERVARSIKKLPGNKGTGLDELPAEILRAGGWVVAEKLTEVICTTVKTEEVPPPWKGGRLVNAWKRKGDAADCPNHRGLLLGDHSGKVFTDILKNEMDDTYTATVPDAQSGCVARRGTAFCCHTSRSFLAYCRQAKLSTFIMFLDLAKAFDFVIREFVMGAPKARRTICPTCWNTSACCRQTQRTLRARLNLTAHFWKCAGSTARLRGS
jgi:hypothetical protein